MDPFLSNLMPPAPPSSPPGETSGQPLAQPPLSHVMGLKDEGQPVAQPRTQLEVELAKDQAALTTLAVVRLFLSKPVKNSARYDAEGPEAKKLQSIYVPYATLGEGKPPREIEVVIRRVR